MSYLDQYDALGEDEAEAKVNLVSRWIRTEWRPFFCELRERRPVFRTPGFTLVTRFPDVAEALSRPTVFSVRFYVPRMDPVVDGPLILSRDETPTNWREKGIMQAMLRPEDLPQVRELAGALADEYLDEACADGRIEAVGSLGRRVPVQICGTYFGFPGPNTQTMYRWSRAIQCGMFKNLQNDPAVQEASVQAGREAREYLTELLRERRDACQDDGDSELPFDILGRLIHTRFPSGLGFGDDRVIANMAGLLIGAVETISQAIVQVLEQLLLRPDVHAEATAAANEDDTKRFDAYVWEALRLNPINPLVPRYCERDYRLATGTPRETVIPAGTLVFPCTASAMFDEEVVSDPDSFRTDRPDFISLHFGYGHHTCLGRHVAGVVVPEVVRRVLLRGDVRLLPPPDGAVDFQGGPFPERFVISLGTDTTTNH